MYEINHYTDVSQQKIQQFLWYKHENLNHRRFFKRLLKVMLNLIRLLRKWFAWNTCIMELDKKKKYIFLIYSTNFLISKCVRQHKFICVGKPHKFHPDRLWVTIWPNQALLTFDSISQSHHLLWSRGPTISARVSKLTYRKINIYLYQTTLYYFIIFSRGKLLFWTNINVLISGVL